MPGRSGEGFFFLDLRIPRGRDFLCANTANSQFCVPNPASSCENVISGVNPQLEKTRIESTPPLKIKLTPHLTSAHVQALWILPDDPVETDQLLPQSQQSIGLLNHVVRVGWGRKHFGGGVKTGVHRRACLKVQNGSGNSENEKK